MAYDILYKGISFFRYQYDKSLVLTDIVLVKQDLYNHIFTRYGDRVKMKKFGCKLPDLLFEQLIDEVVFEIELEIRQVIQYDPRVELVNLEVTPFYDKGTVYVIADLRYIELDIIDRFDLNLEFRN